MRSMSKWIQVALLVCGVSIAYAQNPGLIIPNVENQREVSYTDDCVNAQVASIAVSVTEREIKVKVDLIPKWAEKFNMTCLRNIVFRFGGLGSLGLGDPWAAIGAAVCNAIGPIGD